MLLSGAFFRMPNPSHSDFFCRPYLTIENSNMIVTRHFRLCAGQRRLWCYCREKNVLSEHRTFQFMLYTNKLKSWKTRSLVHKCSESTQSVLFLMKYSKHQLCCWFVKETTEYRKLLGLISCIFKTGCIFSASVNIHG